MAFYKHAGFLKQHNHGDFDKWWGPGQVTPYSGIYRCTNCGDEVAVNKGNPLPPQNHHQHAPGKGAIQWQPIVLTADS